MKFLIIMMVILSFSIFAKSRSTASVPVYKQTIERQPASSQNLRKIITIDHRRGCCSQHGGAVSCVGANIECRDGFISMCGCVD
jgi:hypothetical protein